MVNVFGAPPVDGLGTAGGFKIIIEDRGDNGPATRCRTSADDVVERRQRRRRACEGLFTSFRANTPWLYLNIDRDQAKTTGRVDRRGLQHAAGLPRLAATSTTSTSSAAPGRSTSRPTPTSASRSTTSSSCKVRNDQGEHGAAGHRGRASRDDSGPVLIDALQHVPGGRRSTARPAPGVSSGQAIDADASRLAQQRAAAVDAPPSGPSWPCCSCRPATRPCASSCWPWCWCSWCWRRSTRAGRCRWRSSWSCRCACSARSPAW